MSLIFLFGFLTHRKTIRLMQVCSQNLVSNFNPGTCTTAYICTYNSFFIERLLGGYSDITVSAGQTRVPLGATRNDISAIQVCKNIAGNTKTFDPLVRMRCA